MSEDFMGGGDFLADAAAAADQLAKEQAERFTGGDDTWLYELGLMDGEQAVMRFLPVRPRIYARHGLSGAGGKQFDGENCCAEDGNASCLGCETATQLSSNGCKAADMPVKHRSGRGAFLVFSTRYAFQVPQTSQTGKAYFKQEIRRTTPTGQVILYNKDTKTASIAPYHPLDAVGKAGQVKVQYEGLKIWDCSTHEKANNGSQIFALSEKLGRRCRCGQAVDANTPNVHPAEVRAEGYNCAKCGVVVAYEPRSGAEVFCSHCQYRGRPKERLSCEAGCGNPRRGGLDCCYVRVTCQGSGKNVSYVFEAMPFSDWDPSIKALCFDAQGNPISTIGVRTQNGIEQKPLKDIYRGDPKRMAAAIKLRAGVLAQRGVTVAGADINPPGIGGQGGGGFPGFGGPPGGQSTPAAGGFPGFPGFGGPPAAGTQATGFPVADSAPATGGFPVADSTPNQAPAGGGFPSFPTGN